MGSVKIQKKTFLWLFILAIIFFTIILLMVNNVTDKIRITQLDDEFLENDFSCFRIDTDTLPDISDSEPPAGKSIFFLETSCISHQKGKISITARQACAVESAALFNPNRDVYLLYTSPGIIKSEGTTSDRMLDALLTYENIKIRHIDFEKYTKETPIEGLYSIWDPEDSVLQKKYFTDVLKVLTLWKFGGVYLDHDVVVLKSLEALPSNYAGVQDNHNISTAVLSFAPEGLGRNLTESWLEVLKDNFNGTTLNTNGRQVITWIAKIMCGIEDFADIADTNCQGFHILSKKSFHAISHADWQMYFEEHLDNKRRELVEGSYVMHAWNKLSAGRKVDVKNSNSIYASAVRNSCPKVVEQSGEFF